MLIINIHETKSVGNVYIYTKENNKVHLKNCLLREYYNIIQNSNKESDFLNGDGRLFFKSF